MKVTSLPAISTTSCNYHSCFDCVNDGKCGFCFGGFGENQTVGRCVPGNNTAATNASTQCPSGTFASVAHARSHHSSISKQTSEHYQTFGPGGNTSKSVDDEWSLLQSNTYHGQGCPVGPDEFNYGYITLVGAALYLACFQVSDGHKEKGKDDQTYSTEGLLVCGEEANRLFACKPRILIHCFSSSAFFTRNTFALPCNVFFCSRGWAQLRGL